MPTVKPLTVLARVTDAGRQQGGPKPMKPLAIIFAVWLAFGCYPAHAEDMNCLGTIQTIAGNLWTVPSAASNPTCKARILSRQVKSLLTVCKIAQKCVFVGIVIPRDGDNIEAYWDMIDAKPVKSNLSTTAASAAQSASSNTCGTVGGYLPEVSNKNWANHPRGAG
jgi:hypothetical protein